MLPQLDSGDGGAVSNGSFVNGYAAGARARPEDAAKEENGQQRTTDISAGIHYTARVYQPNRTGLLSLIE